MLDKQKSMTGLNEANDRSKVDNRGPCEVASSHNEASYSVPYKAYLRAVSCALVNLLPFPWRARQPRCVLLGRRYDFSDSEDHKAFHSDFGSRLLFTYRHGFAPLVSSPRLANCSSLPVLGNDIDTSPTTNKLTSFFKQRHRHTAEIMTSDSGWGCMIRVFQMAIAQVLMQLYLGREWRRPEGGSNGVYIYPDELLNLRSKQDPWEPPRSSSCESAQQFQKLKSKAPNSEEIARLLYYVQKQRATVAEEVTAKSSVGDGVSEIEDTDSKPSEKRLYPVASSPVFSYQDRCPNEDLYPWNLLPILALFRDDPRARFSLHRIAAVGRIKLGIRVGAWFGPTSCSDSVSPLIEGSNLDGVPGNDTYRNRQPLVIYPPGAKGGYRLSVYHSRHGEISRNKVRRIFANAGEEDVPSCHTVSLNPDPQELEIHGESVKHRTTTSPHSMPAALLDKLDENEAEGQIQGAVVLFLSFRLGLDSFNMRYQPFIQSCFGIPQFQGLAGGGPLTSAYWFVAANDEQLYFLDPHSPVQPALLQLQYCASLFTHKQDTSRPFWSSKESLASQSEKDEGVTSGWTVIPELKINNQPFSKNAVDSMFFPTAPKQLNWRSLNPSMTLVFLCQSLLAFEDLILRLQEVDTEGLLSIVDEESFGDFNSAPSDGCPEQRFQPAPSISFDPAEDGFYLL
eukprot:Blabericola_migrator_1__1806@NODE_148_length_12903_cov_144_651293_g129_i0_p2_GENE_NODE_148_length_12903_cov_144_651293_g129_i0NODE_148_length_12903_cov_144_651293_g129_i0_p2_ORF_typecomplete_len679_score71_04Peptidase_C54/PF03416_19/3_1e64Peptidase_C78/PF07910_13/0_098Cnl2_NKP2/PF09447_10/0_054Cnl2_NKP2/PF09447_10/7_8e03_NODE_148_length_12903_cov_144_651293_g129_i0860110637